MECARKSNYLRWASILKAEKIQTWNNPGEHAVEEVQELCSQVQHHTFACISSMLVTCPNIGWLCWSRILSVAMNPVC